MPSAKQQRLRSRVRPRVIFIIDAIASFFDCCDKSYFNSRKAYVTGEGLWIHVETTNFVRILFFSKHQKFACFTDCLSQFLSDFVRVKSNVSPRLSTSAYRRETFDRITPLM